MASEARPQPALTKNQEARRSRVIRAALELGAAGGYDAVQMRDVATQAGVALGTIYRYFPSKDALLAAVMVEWLADLERRITRNPPVGETTVERITDVLDQALTAMGREPKLTNALVSAMTAGDPAGVDAMVEVTGMLARVLRSAFPDEVDPTVEASAAKAIGHVWWSATIAWSNGMGGIDWVAGEVREATELIAGRFD
jgi:TetR/AcrR family transcriptional regulator, cholesterol catabolism regulator